MTAGMLHGPETAVGTMTSGGTESILLAVKTYRDRARKKRPWIRRPNMVVPETIHVAFDKAASYFDVKMKKAPTRPNGQVDVKAMEKLIGANTIFVAASAPQYPHGVVDPIPEVGAIAQRRKLPFHVDACFGGFALPWIERLGYDVPPWDFRVPGVTSISADVHKFGYAAKGASVITYRDMSYLKHQFFVATDWPGGIYASPSMPGTRPGGVIAAAWTALMSQGEAGYIRLTREAMEAAARLRAGVEAIDGLRVVGEPNTPVVAWAADEEGLDTYAIADHLSQGGWAVDRQQRPACVHCTVNASNAKAVDEYLGALGEAVAHCRAHPELSQAGEAPMYGMMAKVPLRGLVKASVLEVMEQMYAPGAGVPDLSKVGKGDEDSPLAKVVDKYGPAAMKLLDQAQALRKDIAGKLPSIGGRRS